jgi:hypothetical protein
MLLQLRIIFHAGSTHFVLAARTFGPNSSLTIHSHGYSLKHR